MAYNFEILPRQRLAVILYSGQLARSEFDEVWRGLHDSPKFDWNFDEMAVFGPDAELDNLNFETVGEVAKKFATTHEQVEVGHVRRGAIVVSNQVQVLGARLFLAFIAANPPPNLEIKLFSKVSSALGWIEEGRPLNDPGRQID
ncbi:MAG: hypothetical protein WAW96_19685, partial [Alphaproteobacteria bacterium]